jgi:GT2 family glycosyltransferase
VQDDVEVDDQWLEPLLEVLDRDPTVGAAGSRVSLIDGTPWSDGIVVAHDGWGQPVTPATRSEDAWAVDACFFSGCLVRADAWDSVGGPNPRLFPLQHVDLEFGLRLAEAGWSVFVARDSVVRHVRNASTTSRQLRYLTVRNRQMLHREHHQILSGYPERFHSRADIDAWLDHLAVVARRRSGAPPPNGAARPAVPLSVLAHDARADARRVRVGWTLFPLRVQADRLRKKLRRDWRR